MIILMVFFAFPLAAQKHRKYARQGNREFVEKDYEGSEMLYRRAVDAEPSFNKAVFNLGDALYKQEKYEEAVEHFKELSEKELDSGKLSDSYYNLGNSLLKAGKLEESVEAYKNALRNDPSDMEAKYNLAYALDQLKEQQQQQDDKQQESDGDQQDVQDEQEQDPGEDQQDKQEQNQQEGQEQSQQDEQDDTGRDEKQQQMSREDAERLLQALAENEDEIQEKVKKAKAAQSRVRTLKNW